MKKIFNFLLIFSTLSFSLCKFLFAQDSSAAIFVYHRFGENTFPSTNIKISQFKQHINELVKNDYNVMDVSKIIDHIINKKDLPEKTIGITIDDAYKSIYSNAWPILKAAGLPFTIFVSTALIDSKSKKYMNWEQIKELSNAGVTIGNHTVNHLNLVSKTEKVVKKEVINAKQSFMNNLGYSPDIFSYPYGEYSLKIKNFIKNQKFKAAFGQQSGIIFYEIDLYELPRFAMNEKYGSLNRFKFAANALPIAVKEIIPRDLVIKEINPPLMGFTLIKNFPSKIKCYPSHNIKATAFRLTNKRIEIRFDNQFPLGRTRVNCTTNNNGKWHWFGVQFIKPN